MTEPHPRREPSTRQILAISLGLLLLVLGCCLGAASIYVHRDEPFGSGPAPVIVVTPSTYGPPGPSGGPQ